MIKNLLLIVIGIITVLISVNVLHHDETYNLQLEKLRQTYARQRVAPVDHRKLRALQREFKTPQEVTEACISCHTERAMEVIASAHWNWERIDYIEGRGIAAVGKQTVLNNFCIGSSANEQACAKCHIGFGMSNNQFDFQNARNVDCMVCHDNSETYLKGASMAGYPDRKVNLTAVAQSVDLPRRGNCGSCHFYSGGGNNVKHGDLEEAILACDRDVDVHMGANGMDMSCVTCHGGANHKIKGKLYSVSSENMDRAFCEDCHDNLPHFDDLLNRHGGKVACQTCHIPIYAKVNATKMDWRWSDSGKLKDGRPYSEEDEDGNHTYLSIKGKFVWEKNVQPDYIWFNGTADHYLLGDKITSTPVQMNHLYGSHDDPHSKIVPVKIHRGDQIYDPEYNTLIQPKLYSPAKGDSAFWMDFDWDIAARAGMNRVGLPYSGQYGFIDTEMYWPINHMVSPKEQAVGCAECHTPSDGRLARLTGFYLPGRDRNQTIDFLGNLVIFLSLLGVLGHGAARVVTAIRKNEFKTVIIEPKDE